MDRTDDGREDEKEVDGEQQKKNIKRERGTKRKKEG